MNNRRRFLFGLLATPALVRAGDDREDAWTAFAKWYSGQPFKLPPDTFSDYRRHLIDLGLDGASADATMKLLAGEQPPELIGMFFDKVFTGGQAMFTAETNPFLVHMLQKRKPGAALDIGMGQGRNALFMAKQGWQVTGVDLSEKGIAIANQGAASIGVRIETVRADYNTWDFGRERWDLIAMIYSWARLHEPRFVERVRMALRPGGLIVVEQFNGPQTDPKSANLLFHSFEQLRVIHYEDVIDVGEWGKRNQPIGRLAAVKI